MRLFKELVKFKLNYEQKEKVFEKLDENEAELYHARVIPKLVACSTRY